MAKCKSVCTNKLSNCMSKIDNCLSKSKNLCMRCFMCTSGIIHSRDELPDDWAEDMDVKNEFPLSGVKTQAYLVPDFRSPDHHFWTTQPPPYNRSLLGRWACLCGLLPVSCFVGYPFFLCFIAIFSTHATYSFFTSLLIFCSAAATAVTPHPKNLAGLYAVQLNAKDVAHVARVVILSATNVARDHAALASLASNKLRATT